MFSILVLKREYLSSEAEGEMKRLVNNLHTDLQHWKLDDVSFLDETLQPEIGSTLDVLADVPGIQKD